MPLNLYIKTFGCQMNEYDSNRIVDALNTVQPVNQTPEAANADLIVINTCSIREKAEEKLFSLLGTYRNLKQQNPKLLIAVGGCVASQEGQAILHRAPYVDIIFGPQTLHRLPDLIQKQQASNQAQIDISFPEIEKFDNLPAPKTDGPCAYLSIQEGCSKYCSYCIVPYTRGEEINRPFKDIIKEACQLADQGVKEITLLGQNVNAYLHEQTDLALLIYYLAEIDGIDRIRFTTSHPQEFNLRLIQAYKDIPKLANHLHLPVQSGSNLVLKNMKRGYTREDFIEKINLLRNVRSDISISSDFIVGFPGETAKDFQDTLDLVDEIKFDQSFSFVFSPRPGTPAEQLAQVEKINLTEKKQRLYLLQEKLQNSALELSQKMLGTVQKILVTGPSKNNPLALSGRTENNRIVHFRGQAHHIGQIVPIHIKQVLKHSLIGDLADLNVYA